MVSEGADWKSLAELGGQQVLLEPLEMFGLVANMGPLVGNRTEKGCVTVHLDKRKHLIVRLDHRPCWIVVQQSVRVMDHSRSSLREGSWSRSPKRARASFRVSVELRVWIGGLSRRELSAQKWGRSGWRDEGINVWMYRIADMQSPRGFRSLLPNGLDSGHRERVLGRWP